MNKDSTIAIIGLGYVGYPLALAFSKERLTYGFDISAERIQELGTINDEYTNSHLILTSDPASIACANVYIVTVPTPVDSNNKPDFRQVLYAAKMIGRLLTVGDLVILESTVSPGVTEGEFLKEISRISGLSPHTDFMLGYSPERVNPGDSSHRLQSLPKVIAGFDGRALLSMENLYRSIIPAGIHKANCIRSAELAKLIENTQRDINIAFINEMYQLSEALGLNFDEVLSIAKTKWNFIDFKQGLVGGHCIPVDPYYLIEAQRAVGLKACVAQAAREVNESMPAYMVNKLLKALLSKGKNPLTSNVLVVGVSFKENCAEIKNSKALYLIESLCEYQISVEVFDPIADFSSFHLNAMVHKQLPEKQYDGVILLMPHDKIMAISSNQIESLCYPDGVFLDFKQTITSNSID